MRIHSSLFPPNALRAVARIAAALITFACGDSTSPTVPAKYLISSTELSPIAGSKVVLKAQLVDADDKPVASAGRTVTWADAGTGAMPDFVGDTIARFDPRSSLTLADGSASTLFRTNRVAGLGHKISVIDADGIKGTAADITTVAGPPTGYSVALSTSQPVVGSGVLISAQLRDVNLNASKTAGRVVNWSSTGTGGSFSSPTSTTNSDGIATVTFTVGAIVGAAYTVSAIDDKLAGGVSAVFIANAGPVARYIVSASVIDPPAGADIIIYAQATDAYGNASRFAGGLVTWTKTGSGGSFSSPATSTSADGVATVTFTTSTVAGTIYTISAKDAGGFSGTSPAITTLPQLSLASMATGVGALSSCGIATDGKAWCWGANDRGVLGNGTATDRSLPGKVSGNLNMSSLSASFFHTCGVTTSGVVQCWGENSSGELGDNTVTPHSVPAPIASSLTFTSVTAGSAFTCALVSGGDVYCWGDNGSGQLGDGNQAGVVTKPVKVVGGLSFASISAGGIHTCGVTTSGDAYCWGGNSSGQLGDNSVTDRFTPVAVAGGFKFTSVSTGQLHTCGIAVGGAAYCWGDDAYGQLGFGSTNVPKAIPTLVTGGMSFVAISAGGFHTCGIASGGKAWCWGDDSFGELGNSTTGINDSPSPVAGGLAFKSISAGGVVVDTDYDTGNPIIEAHTCGVTTAGVAYCWGSNDRGELGNGPALVQSLAPLKVGGQP